MKRAEASAIDLSGEWSVAILKQIYLNPSAVWELDRNPLDPESPPETDELTEGKWHTEVQHVPGCWEDWGWSKRIEGPVWYLRQFRWTEIEDRSVLRLEGVSYFCHIWINGRHVGTHRGTWDAFEIEIEIELKEVNILAVEVFKPWQRFFPVKTTLSGFIPYVTCTFGGIWKRISIRRSAPVRLTDLYAFGLPGEHRMHVELEFESNGSATASVIVALPATGWSAGVSVDAETGLNAWKGSFDIPDLAPWEPGSPVLHELGVTISACGGEDSGTVFIGIRYLVANGRGLALNGDPVYLRGVLHWMSYADLLAPVYRPDRHDREMVYLKQAGFNLVKLCLVVPPEEYLDLADRTGMMIWLELPMWMPEVDDRFRVHALKEYAAMVKQIRSHPSVVIWTLGCELDLQADAGFMAELYDEVKALIPGSPLLRDNSGSGEAYGGVDLDRSDFYDYHFYAEADRFSSLIDHFQPGWRPVKPLIFGEYCDSDTLRNVNLLSDDDGNLPWWTSRDPDMNPQGVRWDMNVLDHPDQAAALSPPHSWSESIEMSRRKSLEYRKIIVEKTRVDPRTAGYVVTNIIDTPISTAGLLDIGGYPKFKTESLRLFNGEVVMCLERGRRRIWARGGDRPQHLDVFNLRQGSTVRYWIVASNFSRKKVTGELGIRLYNEQDELIEESVAAVAISSGFVGPIGEFVFEVPLHQLPESLTLVSEIVGSDGLVAQNTWELWTFSPPAQLAMAKVDQANAPGPLAEILSDGLQGTSNSIAVSASITPEIVDGYRSGRTSVVILDRHHPPLTRPRPFWREAVTFIADAPAFDTLPHRGIAGTQFLSITPDLAINVDEMNQLLGEEGANLIRRIDARTLEQSSYWVEWRSELGRLTVTTLPLLGTGQWAPSDDEGSVLGAYLFGLALGDH